MQKIKINLDRKQAISLGIAFVAALGSAMLAKFLLTPSPQPIVITSASPNAQSDVPPPKPIIVEKKIILPAARVLVANIDIPMGKVIEPSDLAWEKWPKDGIRDIYYAQDDKGEILTPHNKLDKIVGHMVNRPINKGVPLTPDALIQRQDRSLMAAMIKKGLRAITLPIEPRTIQGDLFAPGDRVDIVAGNKDNQIRINNVEILALDSNTSPPAAGHTSANTESVARNSGSLLAVNQNQPKPIATPTTVTLQVAPNQVEPLIKAARETGVALILRGFKEGGDKSPPYLVEDAKAKEQQQEDQQQIMALLSELDQSIARQKEMETNINRLNRELIDRDERFKEMITAQKRQEQIEQEVAQGRTIRIMGGSSVKIVKVDAHENIIDSADSRRSAATRTTSSLLTKDGRVMPVVGGSYDPSMAEAPPMPSGSFFGKGKTQYANNPDSAVLPAPVSDEDMG